MIIYFTDRKMNILEKASTTLPDGFVITQDTKVEDIETGVATFECTIPYNKKDRMKLKESAAVGNYILRKNGDENEFYTIIESEADTKNQEVYIYAEDVGLDLLNEVVGSYEADKAYPISHYIEKFAYDSGFVIGINEASGLTRKLSWDGETTATERLASVATQFDNCEISYSFDVKGMDITNKYINIYKQRGADHGIQLRLNYDIDSIVTKESVANLATALEVTGGTPENAENPITLKGYKYDDGDFYISGTRLYSRKALQKWSRYIWNKEPNQINNSGHIVKTYSYDTTSQSELCAHAVTELKKACEIEVNYEVEIAKLPDNVRIGDRVYIIDDEIEMYISARVLKLETSVADQTDTATLGEYLIKGSGIAQKVKDLAEQFSKLSLSAERARQIAAAANENAQAAQEKAESALQDAADAQSAAETAQAAADTANQSASAAQTAADNAQSAVDAVEESVGSLETTVDNAHAAAQQAQQAAEIADGKAEEAKTAAANALADAADAKEAVEVAQSTAQTAVTKADAAQSTADTAKTTANTAKATADAAKQDAETAQDEIDSLGESLTTLSNTMQADYARKTDLTEAKADLQTQISQNAAQISSTASKVEEIDETANHAADQAAAAQTEAAAAQAKADQATADAVVAQTAADQAAQAAANAQNEADTAKTAAQTAKQVADKAQEDLEAAQADLETVTSRVDATEEEIEAAQAAVETAQAAVDKAKADAEAAVSSATSAQTKADNAATAAQEAQTAANDAASKANAAQLVANEAKGDAQAAQETAAAAQEAATAAQNTANTAKNNAETAQTAANEAAQVAADAQAAADEADAKVQQAQTDLATAQQNLADVTSRVDATEEEVEAAQAAVTAAQAAADQAAQDAEAAQSTADTAKNNAEVAQQVADTANAAAQAAQAAADSAQEAADEAQAAVDALAVRVTTAETNITQNAEAIALAATKTEVSKTLGGYYTKEQTEAAIKVESEKVTSSVSEAINKVEVGGRNLLLKTQLFEISQDANYSNGDLMTNTDSEISDEAYNGCIARCLLNVTGSTADDMARYYISDFKPGDIFTFSFWAKGSINSFTCFFFGDTGYVRNRVVASSTGFSATYYGDGNVSMGNLSNNWTRYWVTWELDDTGDLSIPKYVLIRTDGATSGDFYVCGCKLEKGNKHTDWTPAPEDINQGINNAQSSADEANDLASVVDERVTVAESEIEQLADSISMLVTDENGNSLMTQTSEGWRFDIGAITSSLEDAKEKVEQMNGNIGEMDSLIENLDSLIHDLSEKTAYIILATDDSGNPCIELGKEGDPFKVRITNTSMDFMEGTAKVAYISNKCLYIQRAVIRDELQIGEGTGFVWKRRSNGNMGIRWVERS